MSLALVLFLSLGACASTSDSFNPSSNARSAFAEEPLGDEIARVSVVIDVPANYLWDFLADNSKARQWSVFFDRIMDLPPNPSVSDADGLGARRRCYRNRDNRGYFWDEEVVHVKPGRVKRIYTFNVSNDSWPRSWFSEGSETYTDNIYAPMGENQTKFTFATTSLSATSGLTRGFLRLGGHVDLLIEIFSLNLENIKAMVEAEFRSVTYVRPHPYSESYYTGDLDSTIPPLKSATPSELSETDHIMNLERYPVRVASD